MSATKPKRPNPLMGALGSARDPGPLAATTAYEPEPVARAGAPSAPAEHEPETAPEPLEPGALAPGRRLTRAADLGPIEYRAGGRPPAADIADVPPVRLTAYLRPDQVRRLRTLATQRQRQGKRADLSMLLREAVDAAFPGKG